MPSERTTTNGFFSDSEWFGNRIAWAGSAYGKTMFSVPLLAIKKIC